MTTQNRWVWFFFPLAFNLTHCASDKGNSESAGQQNGVTVTAPEADWVEDSLEFSKNQYLYLVKRIGVDSPTIPRSTNADGSIRMEAPVDSKGFSGWTTGFFPGSLWYLHEYLDKFGNSDDAVRMKEYAKVFTAKLEPVKALTTDHDVGFVMYCSYGNGYRLTGDANYKQILLDTAQSLSTRFNPAVGCTKSWDWWGNKSKDFAVIMDNMMNLELLHWATSASGISQYHEMAISHADKTMRNHFRPDHSSFHLVDYDPITGSVIKQQTYQGYADDSTWARGQGWALYGFTMSYRETRNQQFLDHAVGIANYILSKMPEDFVPPWDFNDPTPNAKKDASAAAIYASALYELSTFVRAPDAARFKAAADSILQSLSSPAYRETTVGQNNGFILKHSVGSLNSRLMFEIDVPLNYADYYYLEALLRKLKLEARWGNSAGESPLTQ